MGYSMAIETCGVFDFEAVRPSLERMDLIFMDLKHMDSAAHKRWTGAGNEKVLENMAKLAQLPAEVVIRIPCIGGVNADEDNIRRSAAFVHRTLPKARMELLPYHEFGKIKYVQNPHLRSAFILSPASVCFAGKSDRSSGRHFLQYCVRQPIAHRNEPE